jgi:uncharacterized protein YfeS
MDVFVQMADKIIKEQQAIIGPVAFEQAKKVPGLKFDKNMRPISLEGDEKDVIQKLVEQYQHLFGQTSVEVCKDAIRSLQVPNESLPALLK